MERAAEALAAARSVVVLSGAGLSVESGIPDFRSAGSGVWQRHHPEVCCAADVFDERPHAFWALARELAPGVLHAEPNAAHAACAELQRALPSVVHVTQNVDGLLQRAGCTGVVEVHGNSTRCYCVACKEPCSTAAALKQLDEGAGVPRCSVCDGVLRQDVVLFGEALPREAAGRAVLAAREADAVLCVGTSLTVHPAATLPELCRDRGGTCIVANLDDSGRERADVFLQGAAGEVLPELVRRVAERRRERMESDTSSIV